MIALTILGILLVAAAFLCGVLLVLISWSIHRSMVKGDRRANAYGPATFAQFKAEFEKRNPKPEPMSPGSFFGNGAYVHASIIKFDDKGMLMGPIDWIRVCLYLRSKTLQVTKLDKGLWK